jgi:hypothetical protein
VEEGKSRITAMQGKQGKTRISTRKGKQWKGKNQE